MEEWKGESLLGWKMDEECLGERLRCAALRAEDVTYCICCKPMETRMSPSAAAHVGYSNLFVLANQS